MSAGRAVNSTGRRCGLAPQKAGRKERRRRSRPQPLILTFSPQAERKDYSARSSIETYSVRASVAGPRRTPRASIRTAIQRGPCANVSTSPQRTERLGLSSGVRAPERGETHAALLDDARGETPGLEETRPPQPDVDAATIGGVVQLRATAAAAARRRPRRRRARRAEGVAVFAFGGGAASRRPRSASDRPSAADAGACAATDRRRQRLGSSAPALRMRTKPSARRIASVWPSVQPSASISAGVSAMSPLRLRRLAGERVEPLERQRRDREAGDGAKSA